MGDLPGCVPDPLENDFLSFFCSCPSRPREGQPEEDNSGKSLKYWENWDAVVLANGPIQANRPKWLEEGAKGLL